MTVFHPDGHRHPTHLAARRDGRVVAVGVVGPGFAEVRLLDRDAADLGAIAGARAGGWTGGGYLASTTDGLVLWSGRDRLADLGPGPAGALAATTIDHAWFHAGDAVARYEPATGAARRRDVGLPLLPGVTTTPEATRVLVRAVAAADTSSLLLVDLDDGVVRAWSARGWCIEGAAATGGGRWVVTRMSADARCRQVVLLDVHLQEVAVLHDDASDRGFVRWPAAIASQDHAAYVAVVDGWPHVVVHDLSTDRAWPVLPGAHEDLTDVDDAPAFSPDGTRIALNASRAHPRQRHLHVVGLHGGRALQLTGEPGATGAKAWLDADTLAFIQAGAASPADVRVVGGVADEGPRPMRRAPIAGEVAAVRPVSIDLPGTARPVPADLYLPPSFDDGRRHPAVVYAHGGVFRHMTQGFSTSYPYALLHLVNQRLLALGYVVLSVDYRGSTGYGLAFEQANFDGAGIVDVDDCAAGARWLALQPWVRATSIGIWGLSWGGTMALGALVRHPEVFAAGVSLAGIWDFEQRATFWNALQVGQPIYFDGRMPRRAAGAGVDPRREASARTHARRLRAPLLSLHGTTDVAVDYAQQTLLERDAAEFGLPVETVTLPGEAHVFTTAEAWRVAVDRIEGFLRRTLGVPDG